jgi:hypothetical protein
MPFPGDGRDMASELFAMANMPEGQYRGYFAERTYERGGWPARSASGQAFSAGVAPRVGTGLGLINAPLPIVSHHRAEMGWVGRMVFANLHADPVYTPEPFGAPVPIGQMPELDISSPWDDPESMVGVPFGK